MKSLLPALDGVFEDFADAVTVNGAATSWANLAARADAVGARLHGARAVAVPGTATLDTVVAVAAGLRSGIPVVPVPKDAGPGERAHILGDSGAEIVVGDPDWPDVDLPRVAIDATPADAASTTPPQLDDAATAIIMYTSGTTGLPKGAQIPRRAIAACLDGLADAWQWTPSDHLAHGLPLFHVHGLILGVLGPLRVGAKLTHTGRPDPESYAAAASAGATMFFGVPTVWGRVARDAPAAAQLSSARILVSGSAPLPVPVFDELKSLTGIIPIERYGMTETLITISTRADGDRRPGFVGLPISGVETRIVDEDGAVLEHDGTSIGSLQVRGNTMFNGYLNLADKTAESFTADGWFITGDAASIDASGMHQIAGRESVDIIKSGGYKIGAGEIEAVLLAQPGIDEVAVVGMPDEDLGERVVAFVVVDGSGAPADEVLIETVAGQLSVHKRPREIRRVDSLPRNAMGKVQKKQLRDAP